MLFEAEFAANKKVSTVSYPTASPILSTVPVPPVENGEPVTVVKVPFSRSRPNAVTVPLPALETYRQVVMPGAAVTTPASLG
jgi:hypothetical protein